MENNDIFRANHRYKYQADLKVRKWILKSLPDSLTIWLLNTNLNQLPLDQAILKWNINQQTLNPLLLHR